MEISSSSQEGTEETAQPPKTGFWGFMHGAGIKILGVMDYVGETVVGVLGLDDSKFQYVMDGMDQEDWERAVAIDRERRLEDAIWEAAEDLKAQDTELQTEGGDVEGGGGGEDSEQKKIQDYVNLVKDKVTADFWETEIAQHPELEREIRQVSPEQIVPMERADNTIEVVRTEEVEVIVSMDNAETVVSMTQSETTTTSY